MATPGGGGGGGGGRGRAWQATYPRIRALDLAWFRFERALCGALFLAMALLVFAAVITETFGVRRHGADLVVLAGVCLLAVRTRARRDGEPARTWPRSLVTAAIVTAAIAGAVYGYTELLPGGLFWSQKLTLVMMIWVTLVGASLATYDRAHLALEFGEKLWPDRARRYVKALAHAVTSGFCVACCFLAGHLIVSQRAQDLHIDANPWLPTWVAFLVVPYAFAAMVVRFFAQAVTTATDAAAPAEDQLPT